MATLLPSLNNIAVLVARQVDGSVASFVTEMNRTAHALGIPTRPTPPERIRRTQRVDRTRPAAAGAGGRGQPHGRRDDGDPQLLATGRR